MESGVWVGWRRRTESDGGRVTRSDRPEQRDALHQGEPQSWSLLLQSEPGRLLCLTLIPHFRRLHHELK